MTKPSQVTLLKQYRSSTYQQIRNLGVLCAWEWETLFVSQGQCTRQWTLQEQKELLEKGHVKGYSGHHMYPASTFPEWADAPENIQFLRGNRFGEVIDEHTHAHLLNDNNNLAGYYNIHTRGIVPFNGHPPSRETYPLKENFLETYRKKHHLSKNEAIKYFLRKRNASRRKIERIIDTDGIAKAFELYPKSVVVTNYIVYMKLRAEEMVWERELELVKAGEGTRQWSIAEQEELCSYGKIHGYTPHHIQSAFMAPQHAGDVNNMQLLSEEEHIKAHDGDLRGWSKGFYDPVTREVKPITGQPARQIFELKKKFIKTKRYEMLFASPYINKMITTSRVDASHLVNEKVQD